MHFLLQKFSPRVGAKHSGRQIIAANINFNAGMLRPTVVQ
jgi:hypothetical protein